MTSLNPAFTIGNQLVEGIVRHRHLSPADAKEHAIEMLRRVRIPAPEQRFDEYPHKLSGGMRQRAMIAMALACEPALLVEKLCRLPVTDWLLASLVVSEPQEGGFGMTGSHVFMVNPPWTLRAQLERELPQLAKLLGTFPGARCHIDGRSA
jgi:hypothetical protein